MSQSPPQLKTIAVLLLVMGIVIEIIAIIRISMGSSLGSSLAILISGTMCVTLGLLFLAQSRGKS